MRRIMWGLRALKKFISAKSWVVGGSALKLLPKVGVFYIICSTTAYATDALPNPVNSPLTVPQSITVNDSYLINDTITVTSGASAINNTVVQYLTSITNNSTVAQQGSGGNALYINYGAGGVIGLIQNNGLLYSRRHAVDNHYSEITTLVNLGSIVGSNGSGGPGLGLSNSNNGYIVNLINGQGVGSIYTADGCYGCPSGPLMINNSPYNYSVGIYGPNKYGQLSVNSNSAMSFSIDPSSTLAYGTTYAGVLQGFSSLSNVSPTSGVYNGYKWNLVAGTIPGQWDLVTSIAPSKPIPTLSEWAQIIMMLAMIATAGLCGWRMKQRS